MKRQETRLTPDADSRSGRPRSAGRKSKSQGVLAIESEVTVFNHLSGTAVLIGLYSTKSQGLSQEPGHLSVNAGREVRAVTSALHGPLKWELRDGRIEIQTPPPAECPVDTVILR